MKRFFYMFCALFSICASIFLTFRLIEEPQPSNFFLLVMFLAFASHSINDVIQMYINILLSNNLFIKLLTDKETKELREKAEKAAKEKKEAEKTE